MTNIEKALSHCRDRDEYPNVFNENYGIGITFQDERGTEYTTVQREKTRVVVNIMTFGSSGNYHYYGNIRVYDPFLKYHQDGEEKISSISGYFNRHKPKECLGINIELVRPVTQKDFDENEERWDGYKIGWETPAFNTEEELMVIVNLVIKERFPNSWDIHIDN